MRAPAVLALTLTLSGCSLVFGSGEELLEQVRAAPVPDGAQEVLTETRNGDIERGAAAVVQYGLQEELATACPLVLQGLVDADYELLTFTVPKEPVPDIQALCTEQVDETPPGGIVSIVVHAVPPGLERTDSFAVVLTVGKPDSPYPEGTTLRYDAQS